MVTKTFVGLDGRQNYKNLWDQAAARLNSMGFGCKTTEKWIEVSFIIKFVTSSVLCF